MDFSCVSLYYLHSSGNDLTKIKGTENSIYFVCIKFVHHAFVMCATELSHCVQMLFCPPSGNLIESHDSFYSVFQSFMSCKLRLVFIV